MTNEEKYKTAEERVKAFLAKREMSSIATLIANEFAHWLALEVEEERPEPCPFCGAECDERHNARRARDDRYWSACMLHHQAKQGWKEMKRLEELGISPAPWKVGDAMPYHEEHVVYTQNHRHDDGSRHDKVIATCNHYFQERIADARLIAAAPKLYKALYQSLAFSCKGCEHDDDVSCDKSCVFAKWRAALAEAAGEEVGNGK